MATQTFPSQTPNLYVRDTSEQLANPQNEEQVFYGSFASILRQNIGRFAICEFLIGTNQLIQRSGILYSAGNNFLTLQDRQRKSYTVCDAYSLKFVTFFEDESEIMLPIR